MEIVKLKPSLVSYIWGGDTLHKKFNKESGESIGEAWELSYNDQYPSFIVGGENNGKTLMSVATEKDLGKNSIDMPFFPILVKLIDSEQDLSIQVHPDDQYALQYENQYGKTEMWYVVDAKEGSYIYYGLKDKVERENLLQLIESGKILDKLNKVSVKAGDTFMVESGTIHAIGKGVLIYEVQQNSTLTYRLYDFKRKDKNGNYRELHKEKSAIVSNLEPLNVEKRKYREKVLVDDNGNYLKKSILATSKYFYCEQLIIKGQVLLKAPINTFTVMTVVSGSGKINNITLQCGDSVFIPANSGDFSLLGDMTIVSSKVEKYYIGIDLGGTMIKGGIVTSSGDIIYSASVNTEKENGSEKVINNIIALCETLIANSALKESDISGIGMGSPGIIDSEKGIVTYSNNIGWGNVDVVSPLVNRFSKPVKISNDANAAALGESLFGASTGYKNSVFITLGTGIGSGIVIDNKIYEGNFGAGAELGHMVIKKDGEKCTCGRCGCFEAYCSATALLRDTKTAMNNNKKSKLWELANGDINSVDVKMVFDLIDLDKTAKEIIDNYIENLAEGLANIGNIFRPEVIILGGGVSNAGDKLIKPLQKLVNEKLFGGKYLSPIEIKKATLKNDAGFLGGVGLFLTK